MAKLSLTEEYEIAATECLDKVKIIIKNFKNIFLKIKVNEQLAPNHPGRPTLCPVQLKELRTIGLNAIALLSGRFAREIKVFKKFALCR